MLSNATYLCLGEFLVILWLGLLRRLILSFTLAALIFLLSILANQLLVPAFQLIDLPVGLSKCDGDVWPFSFSVAQSNQFFLLFRTQFYIRFWRCFLLLFLLIFVRFLRIGGRLWRLFFSLRVFGYFSILLLTVNS